MSEYVFNIATDTAGAKLYSTTLVEDITTSTISVALDRVDTVGPSLHIFFSSALSTEGEITLAGIVSAHTGEIPLIPTEPQGVEIQPFASKLVHGKKLYNRTKGKVFSVVPGSNFLEFDILYPIVKFDEIEIINGAIGDIVNLKVLDDDQGSYSTVPYYPLNQFGYGVNVAPSHYSRKNGYDADLYYNMTILIEYITTESKQVYINYGIHEVKI